MGLLKTRKKTYFLYRQTWPPPNSYHLSITTTILWSRLELLYMNVLECSLNNGHHFWVPGVVVAHRFDCCLITESSYSLPLINKILILLCFFFENGNFPLLLRIWRVPTVLPMLPEHWTQNLLFSCHLHRKMKDQPVKEE